MLTARFLALAHFRPWQMHYSRKGFRARPMCAIHFDVLKYSFANFFCSRTMCNLYGWWVAFSLSRCFYFVIFLVSHVSIVFIYSLFSSTAFTQPLVVRVLCSHLMLLLHCHPLSQTPSSYLTFANSLLLSCVCLWFSVYHSTVPLLKRWTIVLLAGKVSLSAHVLNFLWQKKSKY